MLHPLKTQVDGELPTTCLAVEDLNITAFVVPQPIPNDIGGLTEQAGVDRDGVNYYILAYMVSEFEAELKSPNVLTLDFAVDVIGA